MTVLCHLAPVAVAVAVTVGVVVTVVVAVVGVVVDHNHKFPKNLFQTKRELLRQKGNHLSHLWNQSM